jgi:hypothetical protein
MAVKQSLHHLRHREPPRLKMGLGWIPAIDRYLEVVGEINRANDFPQSSVFSITEQVGGLGFTQVLPVCDSEQAILECAMNRWIRRLCRVCGAESHTLSGRCHKHQSADRALSAVKSIDVPGIPTTGKYGAIVAAKLLGDGFFLAFHRYPDRFMPPRETGSCLDQVSTEWEGFFYVSEAMGLISQTMLEHNIDFLPLDIRSFDSLTGLLTAPTTNVIEMFNRHKRSVTTAMDLIEATITRSQVMRAAASRDYWIRWSRMDPYSASDEQWEHAQRWVDDYIAYRAMPYITGFSALDYWAGRCVKPGDLSIAGIHLIDSTRVLGDKGIQEDTALFSRLGMVLPTPSIASPERVVFDLLHDYCVLDKKHRELSLLLLSTCIDINIVFDYVVASDLKCATKNKMRRELDLLS